MPTLEERVAALEAQTPRRSYTSMWSGEEIDRRLLNAAGRNLLDNGLLVGGGPTTGKFPIIQRGITTHNQTQSVKTYTLDRWWNYDSGTFTVTDAGVECSAGLSWEQNIAPWALPLMYNKIVTISAFGILDGKPVGCSYTNVYDKTVGLGTEKGILGQLSLAGTQYTGGLGGPYFELRYGPAFTLVALKVELGPVTTLYHKDATGNWVLNDPPPDPAAELLKCQRYQVIETRAMNGIMGRTEADDKNITLFVPVPVCMRANPRVTIPKLTVAGNGKVKSYLNISKSGNAMPAGINLSITVPESAGIGPFQTLFCYMPEGYTIDANL